MATQINVSLSDRTHEDYKNLAEWQGIPIASLLRQVIEAHWSNPGTQALIKRAKSEKEG